MYHQGNPSLALNAYLSISISIRDTPERIKIFVNDK